MVPRCNARDRGEYERKLQREWRMIRAVLLLELVAAALAVALLAAGWR